MQPSSAAGSLFLNKLSRGSAISIYTLIEFVHIEEYANQIFYFLKERFEDVSVIEAVNTFYRFKIDRQVNLSALFGAVEPNVR